MLSLAGCRCSRWRTVVEWAAPGVIIALLPKCPLCIVAYVAVATGIGISVSTAGYIRIGVLFFCVAGLLLLATRALRAQLKIDRL